MPLPNAEPIGLPAPAWLLQFLLVLTFFLHIVPMSITLGGTVLATVFEIRARLQKSADFKALAYKLWRTLPSVTAYTITIGVAPLLFVQLIYGKFFYPASVITGWSWFAIIPVLIIAYYLLYLQSLGAKDAPWRTWAGLVAMVLFAGVAGIFVSTMSLSWEPETWKALYAESQAGLFFLVKLPRWLHVFFGATSMAGALVMLFGHLSKEDGFSRLARNCGLTWMTISLVVQAPASLWYLSTFNETARAAVNMPISIAAGALGAVGLVIAFLGWKGAARPLYGWAGLGSLVLSTGLLAVQRHLVRQAILAPHINAATDWKLSPQWDVFVVFALLLVTAIGLMGYLALRFMKSAAANQAGKMAESAD